MVSKLKVDSIVQKFKDAVKVTKGVKPTPEVQQKGSVRVRDMRQESMDMGAHGADIFKDGQV